MFCYKKKHALGMTVRESSTSYNKGNHRNNKEAYTDGPKSTGRKVGFADITRGGALQEEASIYTVEMTAMKVIKERTCNG